MAEKYRSLAHLEDTSRQEKAEIVVFVFRRGVLPCHDSSNEGIELGDVFIDCVGYELPHEHELCLKAKCVSLCCKALLLLEGGEKISHNFTILYTGFLLK